MSSRESTWVSPKTQLQSVQLFMQRCHPPTAPSADVATSVPISLWGVSDLFAWRTEKHGAEELGSFSSTVQRNWVVNPACPFAEVFPHQPLM